MNSKVELLIKTKNYLLENGWAQRTFEDDNGGVCLLGAMNRSAGWSHNATKLREAVYGDMVEALTATGELSGIMIWNDSKERTFNDVMDFLDEMILKAKEELGE